MRWFCLIPLTLLLALILGVLGGLFFQLPLSQIRQILATEEIRFALRLTLLTSGAATLIALAWEFLRATFWRAIHFRAKCWWIPSSICP